MAQTFKIKNGDIVINNSTGRPALSSGVDKLAQDLLEFFEVDIQPNGFGAGLGQLVGIVAFGNDSIVAGLADRQIRDGVVHMRKLQRATVRIPRTSDERVLGVSGVQVQQDRQDSTKFYFRVNVITESGRAITLPTIEIGGT